MVKRTSRVILSTMLLLSAFGLYAGPDDATKSTAEKARSWVANAPLIIAGFIIGYDAVKNHNFSPIGKLAVMTVGVGITAKAFEQVKLKNGSLDNRLSKAVPSLEEFTFFANTAVVLPHVIQGVNCVAGKAL